MQNDGFWLVVNLFLSLLFIGISIPLIQHRVPPNHWYGLRIPATHADERVWYAANARLGKEMLALGVLLALMGLVLFFLPVAFGVKVLLWLLVAEVGLLVVVVRSWRFANRLLNTLTKPREKAKE